MYRKLLIAVLLLCGIALAQPPQDAPGMQGGPPGIMAALDSVGTHRKFGPMMDRGIHPLLPPGRWWKDAEIAKNPRSQRQPGAEDRADLPGQPLEARRHPRQPGKRRDQAGTLA